MEQNFDILRRMAGTGTPLYSWTCKPAMGTDMVQFDFLAGGFELQVLRGGMTK